MSLQRRLLLYLLISAPLVWAIALAASVYGARHAVNELFDTELIRVARQVQVLLHATQTNDANPAASPAPPALSLPKHAGGSSGKADLEEMAIAVWNAQGELVLADREGTVLPRLTDTMGFVDVQLSDKPWRLYYLHAPSGEWLVASGQRADERDDIVFGLTATQVVPWLLVLPVLLAAMAWAVRQALLPVHAIAADLQQRQPDDLKPVPEGEAPLEIKPLLRAMNSLFAKIEQTFRRERRFTADAAHELRTPLAVLRAQWDVVQRAAGPQERQQSEANFAAGLDRMDRLVTQMLALSKVETRLGLGSAATDAGNVDWSDIAERAISDCLAIADRRHIEIACEWPPEGVTPLPLRGDAHLLTVMLRNLLDNAVRYASAGSLVTLRFTSDALAVENDGPGLDDAQIARLGERFFRPEGQQETGSGLGVSIVIRIAELHGLKVAFSARRLVVPGTGGPLLAASPHGMTVTVARTA